MDDKENQQPQQAAPNTDTNDMNGFSSPAPTPPRPMAETQNPQDTPPQFTPMAEPQAKKPRKKWLLAAIVAAVLVVLLGGSAMAYKFWYQNPEKVVTDGMLNTMNADMTKFKLLGEMKGPASSTATLMLTGVGSKNAGSVDADVKVKYGFIEAELKGSVLGDEKGNIYVKASNLNELAEKAMAQAGGELPADVTTAVNGFVTKVNGKWIKISADDLKAFNPSMAKQQTCMRNAFKDLQTNKKMESEIIDLYKKHKFVTVGKELGSKDGSLGYELSWDKNEAKEYAKNFKDTEFYKKVHGCDESFKIDESTVGNTDMGDAKVKVQVWVSRWSHQITKVIADIKAKETTGTMTFEPTFNQPVTVEVPKQSMSLKELQQELTNLQEMYANMYGAPVETPEVTTGPMLLN